MKSSAPPGESKLRVFAERYELEELVASGGMGDVWRARHVALDRKVALKILRNSIADRAERLLVEARTLANVEHPAVVKVYDSGIDASGAPYIAMELLNGNTLGWHLARTGGLGAVAAVRLLVPLLSGLSAVHAAGAIHRDLKPENVVLVPGDPDLPLGLAPKLIDFGIARMPDRQSSRLTQTGTFVGTPQYMSPEQLLGAPGDVQSDIWSATVLFYEVMTGVPPFDAGDVSAIYRAITYDPPPFPARVSDLDGRLWQIITRGLRKQPNERFASCAEYSNALRGWISKHDSGVGLRAPADARSAAERASAVTLDSLTPVDALIRQGKLNG